MAGSLYLGSTKICPANVVGNEPEPFPVRALPAKLDSNGYADGKQTYLRLYGPYEGMPFYFDGSGVYAIEFLSSSSSVVSPNFTSAFQNSSIKYVDFPHLSHLPMKKNFGPFTMCFTSIIGGTTGVHIYFRAFNSQTVFKERSIAGLCNLATDATIHFPSNMETIISGVDGYPTFYGTNTTLAFDLPATS